ncbi:unnamed protein product, partial [Symbiodinium sp. KB8]
MGSCWMGRLEFVDWMAELGWMVAGLSVENMAGWRCRFGVGNMAEWLGRFGVENSAACCGFHVNISACCRLGVDDSTTCRLDSSSLDISTCNLGVDSPQNAAQRSRSQPASASTTAPAPPAGPAPVFDPKRLLYRSQAKQFVTLGSLFTLICLAGLIYGRLSMRRGGKHGEGCSDVGVRLGIFLPPFVSATFSLMLRKHANPIRSTLAVQSLASFCFFVSLGCLAVTMIWWHASAPSINLARSDGAEETYLKGISLQVEGWPIFFHPTGMAVSGNSLLLSAAFRMARFVLARGVARLESETTFPGLEIGDISFCGNQSAVNSSLALAGRDIIAVLATEVLSRPARVTWRDLPNASFGRSIQ